MRLRDTNESPKPCVNWMNKSLYGYSYEPIKSKRE